MFIHSWLECVTYTVFPGLVSLSGGPRAVRQSQGGIPYKEKTDDRALLAPPHPGIERAMNESVPELRLRGVRKQFGGKVVLDGIDLDVMPRTSLVVIGGSGSGKSVLLKCILGLIEPDDGVRAHGWQGEDRLRVIRAGESGEYSRVGEVLAACVDCQLSLGGVS